MFFKMVRLSLLGVIFLQGVGCVAFYGNRDTYMGGGKGAKVNGAMVSMQVRPEGTKRGSYEVNAMVVAVGVANLDGPFRWRIEAVGKEGVHEALYVQGLRTVTAVTKKDERYPQRWLGERIDFVRKSSDKAGEVRAVFDIPGLLQVKPEEDGALTVYADVIVVAKGRRERGVVKFSLSPTDKSEKEVIFLPAEIVSSIGKPMSEWEDKGWDE